MMNEARAVTGSDILMEILNLLNLENSTMVQKFQNDQELPAEQIWVRR